MSEPSVTLLNGRSIMVPTELSLVGPPVNRPRSPMPNTIVWWPSRLRWLGAESLSSRARLQQYR